MAVTVDINVGGIMRRSKTTIAVGLLLVTFGGFVVSVWLTTRIPEIAGSPCRDCFYETTEIQNVSLCKLLANPNIYQGKLIRVRALFHHDAGQISFQDETCPGGGLIYLDFDEAGSCCIGTKKALMVYTGYGSWYDSAAYVTAVGTVANFENPEDLKYTFNGFIIKYLERVEPTGSDIRARVFYTVGKATKSLGF